MYTVKELAIELNVSTRTIYRWLGKKQIPFAKKICGSWRFPDSNVEDLINKRKK